MGRSLLASLAGNLRASIPFRQFEIFERAKLKHQSPKKCGRGEAILCPKLGPNCSGASMTVANHMEPASCLTVYSPM